LQGYFFGDLNDDIIVVQYEGVQPDEDVSEVQPVVGDGLQAVQVQENPLQCDRVDSPAKRLRLDRDCINGPTPVYRAGKMKEVTRKTVKKQIPPTISVLFVDQTVGGVLAKRLQQVEDRLADVTGYRIRISETSGTQLCRLLPSTNPWGQRDCERQDCYTCGQGGEDAIDCKVRNVLYESACVVCNGDKFEKKSKWDSFKEMVGVYVGETSRSIFERAGEHWQDVKAGKVESHMLKHWEADHPEDKGMPRFKIRVVRTCQDALSRQVGESVRIDLRGGNVLNSRTEYSRCRLPRLTIDREEWKTAKEKEKKVSEEDAATGVDELTEEELAWLTEEEAQWQPGMETNKESS
jgi:hypothetical protein